MDPKAKTLNPFGMKPFGWYWAPGTPILAGEVCCPSSPDTGNGHTYQAQNAGTTGQVQPVWPLTEAGTVNDNGVVWKEKTMVIANRLPPPPAAALSVGGVGTLTADQDVYIVLTLLNTAGETLPGATAPGGDLARLLGESKNNFLFSGETDGGEGTRNKPQSCDLMGDLSVLWSCCGAERRCSSTKRVC
ncbi:MAG TPA: hypothetical protein VK302_08700 [Terriglobales bacterium]|nr:hypothetical protein [Terriglobales bacterium]